MKKLLTTLTIVFILVNTMFAQEQNFEKSFFPDRVDYTYRNISLASPNTNNYDLKHYRFNINIDPAIKFISGSVTPRFLVTKDNSSEIYFDFNSVMIVDSVKYHGEIVNSTFTGNFELKIDLPEAMKNGEIDSIDIWYRGNPSTSGFGSFEASTQYCDDSKALMWTLSEPYGARDWWPTKQSLNDKIDSVDLFVTTPTGYKVGSNGLLMSVIEEGNKLTHHWKHIYPEPAYLIAIAVSDYAEYIDWVPLDNGDSLMVLEYVFPCNLDYAKDRTPDIIPTMQFFIELFGEYPYSKEKYGHAQFGWGGGMEHASMTFVTGFSHGLLAHELAHQWFGDKITCGSWQDIWLNEGFATYLEGLTYDFDRDPLGWENWKKSNRSRALGSRHGSVFVADTSNVGNIFNGSLSYAKGAFLLHMLRWKLGDDDFFQAIRNYINDPKLEYGYARTVDLQNHLETVSGQNLNEFFNDWLYGKGNPTYSFDWWYTTGGQFKVEVSQTQSDASVDYFEMPVPIRLKGEGQDTLLVLDNSENDEMFLFDIDFKVDELIFDPDIWLCASYQDINYLKATTVSNSNEITIFPNPASDFIDIKIDESVFIDNVSITDLDGKIISVFYIQSKRDQYRINLMDDRFATGIYLLKIVTNDKVYIEKVMMK